MKRKFVLLIILMCILGGFNLSNLNAQTQTVTIGDGSAEGMYSPPIDVYYANAISQQIFPVSSLVGKIPSGSVISKIAFKHSGGSTPTRNWSIYMQNSQAGVFVYPEYTASSKPVESSDKVYSKTFTITPDGDGWVPFDLTEPFFTYEGGDLIITVIDNTGESGGDHWWINSFGFGHSIHGGRDVAYTEGSVYSFNQSYTYTSDIQLTFTAGEGGGEDPTPEPEPSTPLSATITADNEQICENETIQFNVTATGGSGSYSYSWSPTDGLSNPTIANPILSLDVADAFNLLEYTCTVTDVADNTQSQTVSKQVYIYGVPEAQVAQDYIKINYGETATLSGIDPGIGYSWEWQPADKLYVEGNSYPQYSRETATMQLEETTEFTYIVYNQYSSSCRSETTVTVEVIKPLSATASTEKESIYSDESVQLTATADGGTGNYTYSWSPATGLNDATIENPIFTPSAVGTYTFTCTVSDGTETVSTNKVTVIVEDAPLSCFVIFTLSDTYGDGWNGNYLTVQYGETSENSENLTLSTGSTETFTRQIPQETKVTVTYNPVGSYASENSYVITYEGGENITSGTGSNNAFSETFTVDCSPKAPKAPEVFAKATSETSVLLAWNNVEGATSYNIYNGNNIVEEDVKNTSYTINGLTTGQEYCYTVTAVNEVGESDESNEACVTPKAIPTIDLAKYYRIKVYGSLNYLYFSDPYYYYYTSGTTQATVAATLESSRQIFKIEDAGNGNYYVKTLDGYYIKCADQPNADGNNWWSVFAYSNENSNEIKTPLHFDYVDDERFYIRDFDKVLGNGSDANKHPNSNYFKVDNGVYCDASIDNPNVVTWVLEEVPSLANVKPTNLVAELNGRSAILTWDVVEGATSYNVYLDGNKISTDMITTRTYTVDGLSAETEYCFTVTANNLISESSHSDEACVTTGAKELPEVPNLLSISVNTTTITLTWEASAGATSYNVYRDGEQVQTGITELTYSDSGLTEDMRYCYSVSAVNGDGESEQSDELCAKTTKVGSGGDVVVGDGSENRSERYYLPIAVEYMYSMSQQLYAKSEIDEEGGGTITSVAFSVKNVNASATESNLTRNIKVFLTNLEEEVTFVDQSYVLDNNATPVFEGNVVFSKGWVELPIVPFAYTGNHILVTVVNTLPDVSYWMEYPMEFDITTISPKKWSFYCQNNNSARDPKLGYSGSVPSYRSNIRFGFLASSPTIEFITDGDWNDDSNWNKGVVPSETDDVIIKANATINGDVAVKHLSVEGGSLTIESGSLTVADIMVNNYAEDLIIKDGAQLLQGYDKVKGTFQMNINNPEEWSEWNKTGWQFIASPFTNAAVSQFTDADTYDLYKFDGSHENITEEWRNHKADANFETEFVSGRGYMASYQNNTTATLSGTFNSSTSINYPVTYQDIQEGEPHWPNFHLLGNPFTFNMDLSKLNMANMATGVAVVNDEGGYDYMAETGTINVGDGFFVKSVDASPSVSYGTRGGNNNNVSENISVRVSNSTSRDNVVLNFAGADKVGFPKLNAMNEDIAYLYVVDNEKRYGIFNYDKDVKEVPLSFETQKMGRYTISVDAEGEYETIVLVDRQTGIETNMLLEDYNFTATTSKKENTDRFIVRFTFKSDEVTETERFAYQSGDELIIEAEGTVQLFDVMGRMLYINDIENHGDRINVGHLNNAAYILRLVNGDGVKVQKVIIY